jgi:hypothetical protein
MIILCALAISSPVAWERDQSSMNEALQRKYGRYRLSQQVLLCMPDRSVAVAKVGLVGLLHMAASMLISLAGKECRDISAGPG